MNCPHCGSCRNEVIRIVDQLLSLVQPFGAPGYVHITGSLLICHSCEEKFFIRGERDAVTEVEKEK